MDRETKSQIANPRGPASPSDQSVDDFFNRLQSDMRRPDLSQEAIAAAFQAIQRLALDADTEEAAHASAPHALSANALAHEANESICPACNSANPPESKFCAACGVPREPVSGETLQAGGGMQPAGRQAGEHFYHHHYHHHYFPGANGTAQPPAADVRAVGLAVPSREAVRGRTPAAATSLSRAEAAVRKMTLDWAQACNTKQLDDLVDLYSTDAQVLRPNMPAVRGAAAIREFFFSALEAGLGEAELEPLRVELFGDIAYEAGRCKTLVPSMVGKRREERGKYLMLFAKQPTGNWKILADSWSSDLSIGPEAAPLPEPRSRR